MKALTVWQPWALLILISAKPYEFRRWKPPASIIGQRIAIHAGARLVKRGEVGELLTRLRHPERWTTPCLHPEIAEPALAKILADPGIVPRSVVLCTAVLGEPKNGHECAKEFGQDTGNDSDREGTFNWGWPLSDIEPVLPPAPARGRQGLWNWRS